MSEVEIKKGSWERLTNYWKSNVQSNIKKISATFGSMIVTVFGLLLYGTKAGLDIVTILMTLVFAMQPFFNIWINIIFKGEAEIQEREILLLTQQLDYARELSEYQLKVVALKANISWNKANELLNDVKIIDDEKNTP